jgi:hypothetical protein
MIDKNSDSVFEFFLEFILLFVKHKLSIAISFVIIINLFYYFDISIY